MISVHIAFPWVMIGSWSSPLTEMFKIWSDGQKAQQPKNNDDDGYDDADDDGDGWLLIFPL